MFQFVILAVAVLSPFRTSDALCTQAKQIGFVISLPNGLACGLGFQAANNTPTGTAGIQALDKICTEGCAGAVAGWLAGPTCNDSTSAGGLSLWCQPADQGTISRCRFALDQIDPSVFNNTNINSCGALAVNASTCPSTCTTGLTDMAAEIGCCYQLIYNNTMILDGLVVQNMLTQEQRWFLTLLSSPASWETCSVPIPGACTSPPFRMDPVPTMVTTASGNIIDFSFAVIILSFLCAFM